jgi:benzoate-CoA ligase family protein
MNLYDAIFPESSSTATAVVFAGRDITYAELGETSLHFARVLKTLQIEPGDRVALLLNDSPEFVSAFIAICSSGYIAVPINLGLQSSDQKAILNDCRAHMALVEVDRLLDLAAAELPFLEDVVVISRDGRKPEQQATSMPRVQFLSDVPTEPTGPRFPNLDESAPAFILYTSGSTGEPKGAVHSQADIFYTNQTYCREVLQLRAGDRLFSSSRLPFAYGLGNTLSFPLLNGVTSILCAEKPTPEVISAIFKSARPTIFFAVPVVYRLLLDHEQRVGELDCSSLRLCISAGEALPAQLGEDWERTFGVEVLDGIGSTEMLHMFMSNHEGKVKYGSSGTLLEGYDARLLDEHGQACPEGVEGHLWIKGGSATKYYWEQPQESVRTFVDGWVRTGDLYQCDADGYWFHMGRSDDCFKSSGQWVSPVEVEGVLLRHKGVSRTAVVEHFDEAGLPCPCAFVIPADVESNRVGLEDELRLLAKDSLLRFKRPRKYLFVEELPYTATGKIQRFKLRQQLRDHAQR